MSLITDPASDVLVAEYVTNYDLIYGALYVSEAKGDTRVQTVNRILRVLNGRKIGQPATSSGSVGPHESFGKEYRG